MQSITVSAGGDSNDPLSCTINAEMPAGGTRPDFILSEIDLPSFPMRVTYAPDSDAPGKALLAATLDAGTLPLVLKAHGTTMANLQVNRRYLEGLFSQIAYTVTLDLDGEEEVYNAFPTWPTWEIDLRQRIATATLSVPVNPLGA